MPRVIHSPPVQRKILDTNQDQETNPSVHPDEASSSSSNPIAQTSLSENFQQEEFITSQIRTRQDKSEAFYALNKKSKPEKVKTPKDRRKIRSDFVDNIRQFVDEVNSGEEEEEIIDPSNLFRKPKQPTGSAAFKNVPTDPFDQLGATSFAFQKSTTQDTTRNRDSGFDTLLETNITGIPRTEDTDNHSDPPETPSEHTLSSQTSTESEMAEVSVKDILSFKIPFFSGDQKELDGFLNTCKMYNELTPEALKGTLLNLVKAKITGDALSKIQPITGHENLANLLKILEETIRKPVSYEFANEDLSNIMQNRDETIEAYGKKAREALHRLNKSSIKVSDNVQEQTVFRKAHEKLAISKFTQNLRNPQLRVAVAAANKLTLEECIVYAMERELIEKNSNLRTLSCNICGSNQHRNNDCPRNRMPIRPNTLPNRFRGPQQPFRPDFTLPTGSTPYRYNPNNSNINNNFFRNRYKYVPNTVGTYPNNNQNNQERRVFEQQNKDNDVQRSNNNNNAGPSNRNNASNNGPQYKNTSFQNNTRSGFDNTRSFPNNNRPMNQYRNNQYSSNSNSNNNQNRNARTVSFQEEENLCEEMDLATLMDQESYDTVDRKNY